MKSASRFNVILVLILGISASAFAAYAGEGSAVTASSIEGLWLRPVGGDGEAGGQGGKEGFYLHDGGSLELVGIASMNGLGWKVEGSELVLTTNTDRYPEPVAVKYTVESLTGKTLVIKADDYLSGTFEKEDPASSAALRSWRAVMDKLYIDNASEYVKYVDGNEAQYTKTEKTLGPEKKGWETRKLVLWTEDGAPVRLTFAEPDDAGRMKWQTIVYYLGGQINYYKGPFAGYIFKNGRLVLGVDGEMKPLSGITGEDMRKTVSAIEERSNEYLALFNPGK